MGVLVKANVFKCDISEGVRPFIVVLIAALDEMIPALAIGRDAPGGERRMVEGYLLNYTILDQGNHAAAGWVL